MASSANRITDKSRWSMALMRRVIAGRLRNGVPALALLLAVAVVGCGSAGHSATGATNPATAHVAAAPATRTSTSILAVASVPERRSDRARAAKRHGRVTPVKAKKIPKSAVKATPSACIKKALSPSTTSAHRMTRAQGIRQRELVLKCLRTSR